MKKLITIFLLLNFSVCIAQTSLQVDSLVIVRKSEVINLEKEFFDKIYLGITDSKIYKRLDSLAYKYAFINIEYCALYSEVEISEYYFEKKVKFPTMMYRRDSKIDVKENFAEGAFWNRIRQFKYYTFRPLHRKYSKLKKFQSLKYEKMQISWRGCVIKKNWKSEFKKRKEMDLKNTYQIQIYIYKNKNKNWILVSMQSPSKNPRFRIRRCNIASEMFPWMNNQFF